MASLNQVTLLGNLTRDPECKYLQDGTAVCDLGLAVNETYKTKSGDKKEDTLFIDCTCWSRTAEIATEYLRKGQQVLLTGKLKQDRWEKDGQKHTKIRMTVNQLVMLGSKPQGNGGSQDREDRPPQTQSAPQTSQAPSQQSDYPPPEDSIPF